MNFVVTLPSVSRERVQVGIFAAERHVGRLPTRIVLGAGDFERLRQIMLRKFGLKTMEIMKIPVAGGGADGQIMFEWESGDAVLR